ncbi:CPBP family intramembrane glutamic endopeptidase [Catalinimonas niigatensis]|uniref:CPBP family intramembrane glutamic endopeptidase n=1 Tax=Catalinimonas niigatensis TaxID=1397264 RepID=UPI0026670426|nr:CPBP family intramembrane glutamic endopeptidase [Catalinimonas niigatensis]WPP52435.1 CPBP family intramembrane glutamic endopeptidase [Catalinimonas niigatensis]
MQLSSEDYHKAFRRWVSPGWFFALILLLILSIVRFILVLQANMLYGNYQFISYLFMAMVILPFLLLNRRGRKKIGIKRIERWKGIGWGMIFGIMSCALIFVVMYGLFGKTENHAFTYIARTFQGLPEMMDAQTRLIYFFIFAGISMFFSPLGEELFYRGFIHESFAVTLGHSKASLLDSLAFSLVHLAHFGIVYLDGQWQLLFWPSVIWMVGLFGSCLLFNRARVLSGSILGAIVAHACFNLTMTYFIFYHILI